MVFVASLIMAIAIEHCSLHRRIALRVMLCVGTDPKWCVRNFNRYQQLTNNHLLEWSEQSEQMGTVSVAFFDFHIFLCLE